MDTDLLVYQIATTDFYTDIADDIPTRFDTSGYSKDTARPLPIGLNKKVIGLMKEDELGGQIMTEFIALRLNFILTENLMELKIKSEKESRNASLRKLYHSRITRIV